MFVFCVYVNEYKRQQKVIRALILTLAITHVWQNCQVKMPKQKVKYNPNWEKEFPWVSASKDYDNHFAYCKICKDSFSVGNRGRTRVVEHGVSAKHVQNLKTQSENRQVTQWFTGNCFVNSNKSKLLQFDFLI